MTISLEGWNRCRLSRNTSRSIRLILLRRTAPRIIRCTLMPNRRSARPLALDITVNPDPFWRLPCRYTCINSHDLLRRLSLGSPNCFTGSCCQSFSSLGPSIFNHRLAGTGAHTHQETVGPLTLGIAWLECSFTHYSNSFSFFDKDVVSAT